MFNFKISRKKRFMLIYMSLVPWSYNSPSVLVVEAFEMYTFIKGSIAGCLKLLRFWLALIFDFFYLINVKVRVFHFSTSPY